MKIKILYMLGLTFTISNCFILNNKDKSNKNLPLLLAAGAVAASSNSSNSSSSFEQFTPNQADWDSFNTKPFVNNGNRSHDPNGVSWLTATSWENARWNGTPYDPTTMSRTAFTSAICPSGDQIRGIREVFYNAKPFADNRNPTKAELDEWHRIALNHIRALVGYTSEDRKVKKDHCMFKRAHWGQERIFTKMWDTKYPGALDSAYGPCGTGNSHCGATFLPNAADQASYLPAGQATCTTQAGSEGVTSAPKSNIPWSIKWSRAFCAYLGSEGFWGGHVGPFFHREKFGFSFWDLDKANNNSNANLRAKWTGRLNTNLFTDPSATPDPENSF